MKKKSRGCDESQRTVQCVFAHMCASACVRARVCMCVLHVSHYWPGGGARGSRSSISAAFVLLQSLNVAEPKTWPCPLDPGPPGLPRPLALPSPTPSVWLGSASHHFTSDVSPSPYKPMDEIFVSLSMMLFLFFTYHYSDWAAVESGPLALNLCDVLYLFFLYLFCFF